MTDHTRQDEHQDNIADLRDADAVERIRSLVGSAETCFFCTRTASETDLSTRPMSVRRVDSDGALWFLSAIDSNKNAEIAQDPSVTLYFQGSPHSEFLHLRGQASIMVDRKIIESLWDPMIKVWFTEGVNDPRISAIRFAPRDGYYWDTKHGTAIAGVKMMIGAAIGRTMDDSIEGRLHV